jgi:hypothetical protein
MSEKRLAGCLKKKSRCVPPSLSRLTDESSTSANPDFTSFKRASSSGELARVVRERADATAFRSVAN